MNQLQLSFLGPFTVIRNREAITDFESNKVRALLVYLAVERQSHARDALATLLWPEYGEANARTNLRQVLYQLRRTLGDEEAHPHYLIINRQTIGLNPAADTIVDITTFNELVTAAAAHHHDQLATCELCLERLRQAVELYHNDFLTGFALDDSDKFEEWRRMTQEQLHLQAFDALHQLTNAAIVQGDTAAVLRYAQRQLALEPWHEEAHRQIMRVLAHNGQRAAALAHYQSCRQVLQEELGVEPDRETAALYEEIRTGALDKIGPKGASWQDDKLNGSSAHPIALSSSYPAIPVSLLPVPGSTFVGRETQVQRVLEAVLGPQQRLVTLMGLGGVGKTRLAQAVAQAILDWLAKPVRSLLNPKSEESSGPQNPKFSNGVWFIPLAGITIDDADPGAALSQTILQALNVAPNGSQSPGDQLLNLLRHQQMLLILDNFEHLQGAKSFLVDLLQAAPQVQLLVTSQVRLNLPGETVIRLTGLPTPARDDDPQAGEYSSIQLFVQQVQRIWPDFVCDAATLPAIVRICRLVNGLPLGIELTARWVQHFTCDEIVQTLQENLSLLENTVHKHPERHHTLYAVFASAWSLLTPAEQRLLARLALFQGSFSRAVALAVTGAKLTDLASLVDKSLVQQEENPTGAGWYTLHELVRQFARDKLRQERGATDAHDASVTPEAQAQARYVDYYIEFLQARLADLKSVRQQRAVEEILLVIDDVEAAWRGAAATGNVVALGKADESLWYFSHIQGRFREGEALFALAATRLAELVTTSGETAQTAQKLIWGQMLGWQSWFSMQLGRYPAARALAAQSLDLLTVEGSAVRTAIYVHISAGLVHRFVGESDAAIQHFTQGLALANHLPDPWASALCTFYREPLKWLTRHYGHAAQHYQASLTQFRAIGDPWPLVDCLFLLGEVYVMHGEYPQAEACLQEGLAVSQKSRYHTGIAYCYMHLGDLAQARGQLALAAQAYQQSLQIFEQTGDDAAKGTCLRKLGLLALANGDTVEATRQLTASLLISEQFGIPGGIANTLLCLGYVQLRLGSVQRAYVYFQNSFERLQTLRGREELLVGAYAGLGAAMLAAGDAEAATKKYQQALALAVQIDAPPLALDLLVNLAGIWIQQGVYSQTQLGEFLALAHQHPASTQETKARAAHLMTSLHYLTGADFAAANRRGQARDWRTVVTEILTLGDERKIVQTGKAHKSEDQILSLPDFAVHAASQPQSHLGANGAQYMLAPERSIVLSPLPPLAPAPLRDWGEMPVVAHFHGRRTELAQLEQWLLSDLDAYPANKGMVLRTHLAGAVSPTRLVTVLGMGGAGKTTLVAKLVQEVADQFAIVSWRSLLNAPPPDEILRGWLQLLSHQRLTHLPDSFEEGVQLLLDYLRQQRCLLVLDNGESILQTGEYAGQPRPGYEGYSQLLQRLGAGDHASCLVLTSREQPHAIGHLAEATPAVQILYLTGLDAIAGQAILQTHGLHASPADVTHLIEHYSGNPLALQMVASTIVNFFGSDIALFQRAELSVFDSIGTVLDEQFARLSAQEREIVRWLAIAREPVTASTLHTDLIDPPPMHLLLTALRSLQRRSLLEKVGAGFTLQNVVMEYVTERLVEEICEELLREDKEIGRQGDRETGKQEAEEALAKLSSSLFNRHALLKAQAKEYVRQSQMRLILQPIAQRLVAKLGRERLLALVQHILKGLRPATRQPGYAGGNSLNLLIHLGVDLTEYDFSRLCVWQADLRQVLFAAVNFTEADLGRTIFTLTFNARAVQFRPTGEVMVAGLVNEDLCLWQDRGSPIEGQLAVAFRTSSNGGHPLIFNATGELIAAAGLDYVIRVWSTANGERLQSLHGHTSQIYSLALSADGSLLASGTAERLVYLWDLRSGQLRQTLNGHANGVGALAFSPHGRILASGGSDCVIRLWDTEESNGQLLNALYGHTREIGALAFAPDGSLLVSGGHDGVIRLWDLNAGGRCLQVLQGHTSIVRVLCFHPGGRLLASGSADQTLRLWTLSGQLLYTLLGHRDEVESLAFNQDGRLLVSSGADQRVYLWDTHKGDALNARQAFRHSIPTACFSPDGCMVASGGSDGLIRLRKTQTGQTVQFLPGHSQQVRAVAFSPADAAARFLASGSDDQTIRLWALTTGQELHALQGHRGAIRAVAFSPDGALLASGGSDQTVRLWAVAENLRLKSAHHRRFSGHQAEITALAFSPDGQFLISCSLDRTARLWALDSGDTVHILAGHTAAISSVAINLDGCTVATISFDRTVRLWNAVTGHCLTVRSDEHIGNRVVAFSPDGELLAYESNDFAIYVWRWRTWELVAELSGHTDAVLALDFSPTASLLVSSSWDGTLRLWDLEKSSCVQTLRDPGPYAGMNITGVTGISDAQKTALKSLGAIEL